MFAIKRNRRKVLSRLHTAGARPSIRFITRNGDPNQDPSGSNQGVRGTGTDVCAPTTCMHRCCSTRSYVGNTG